MHARRAFRLCLENRVMVMKSPTTDKVIDRLKQPYCMGFVRMKYKHLEKQKSPRQRSWAFKLAGELGFEPRQAESESAVLPLDDTPVGPVVRGGIMGPDPGGQGSDRAGPGSVGSRAEPHCSSGFGFSVALPVVPARSCQAWASAVSPRRCASSARRRAVSGSGRSS